MHGDRLIKVLVIDDDRVDRELFRRYLLNAPASRFEFAESDSVTAGVEKAKSLRPDCVLLDFNLPDMNGIEAMGWMKGELGQLPWAVILLTAFGGEELAVKAMKAGAMDYLPKDSVNAGTLARAVIGAIERHQLQQRIEDQRSALENSWRRYQVLLEAIPQMVWTVNAEGRVEYVNRRWLEYTGLAPEKAGRLGWDQILHPDDRDRTWGAWKSALASGTEFEIEHRLRRASDASYRWHLVRAVPMQGESGRVTNWFGTCTEIEDQKQNERAILEKQKLEGIGALAGGVAHDFNNLLTGILGGASCAMERLPESHNVQDLLRGVVQAGEQAAELTRKMLAYAGKGSFFLELVDIGALVQEICETLRPSIPVTIRLECLSGRGVPPVETDRTQMRQVIVDLVTNAAEAIGEGITGRISVHTAVVEIDEESIRKGDLGPVAISPGRYVTIEVRDTGCGMNEETQNRIFDPFFTTKFIGRGLGLAAVHGFVRSHKGGVQLHSAPGKGTIFRLLLPAQEPETARGMAG
jgi:two-component system, cell cycle sensor histidine kinase and response regulator CckA